MLNIQLYTGIDRFNQRMRGRQTGGALLVFMLLMIVGTSFVLLTGMNERRIDQFRLNKTQNAISLAKEALIAYAVTNYERNAGEFGFLPCPDVSGNGAVLQEGIQDGNCGATNVNTIGRFPWSTLELSPLTDGDGECLWYAVSGQYKANPKTDMLNTDSRGYFQIFDEDGVTLIAGATPETRPVAVIIAPGASIAGQDRSIVLPAGTETVTHCGGNYNPSNYLETLSGINNAVLAGAAADTIDQFITTTVTNNNQNMFNDVITYVTMDEIMTAVQNRTDFDDKLYDNTSVNNLTRKITECLADYGATNAANHGADMDGDGLLNQSLPWPAPLDLGDYREDDEYDDRGSGETYLAGRLPITIDDSNDEIYDGCAAPQTCAAPNDNLIDYCDNYWVNAVGLTAAQSQELQTLWRNWKDHLFYVVSQQYQPRPVAQDVELCSAGQFCVTTDLPWSPTPPSGTQDWAAIVIFSNTTVAAQSRNAPPLDAEEKNIIGNYLEDVNTGAYNDGDGNQFYSSIATAGGAFNDILYCINDDDGDDGIAPWNAGLCP